MQLKGVSCNSKSGSEKGVFWKRGLFRKVQCLEVLENLEIPEFLENPQTLENKGESDHFLEILENLEILEIPEIPAVKRPLQGRQVLKLCRSWPCTVVTCHHCKLSA